MQFFCFTSLITPSMNHDLIGHVRLTGEKDLNYKCLVTYIHLARDRERRTFGALSLSIVRALIPFVAEKFKQNGLV